MLAIFILAAMIGLAVLVYFRPGVTAPERFNSTRIALTLAMFGHAGSAILMKFVAVGGGKQAVSWSILCETAGWICLAVALKGIFVMLASHGAVKAFKNS